MQRTNLQVIHQPPLHLTRNQAPSTFIPFHSVQKQIVPVQHFQSIVLLVPVRVQTLTTGHQTKHVDTAEIDVFHVVSDVVVVG